ncbi:hypothetical protein ANN_23178 [Periplaneta americana]|uniref:Uncharacterized protein n=1 Tax=Periplaneta americana TaxID=6978 RepID=A0ABQ8SLM7_PERAM|nr:hypothetical protein ANN_23178 [Periplaneta americana]
MAGLCEGCNEPPGSLKPGSGDNEEVGEEEEEEEEEKEKEEEEGGGGGGSINYDEKDYTDVGHYENCYFMDDDGDTNDNDCDNSDDHHDDDNDFLQRL